MNNRFIVLALAAGTAFTGATAAEAATNCGTVSFSPGSVSVTWDSLSNTPVSSAAITAQLTPSGNSNSARVAIFDTQTGTPLRVGISGPQYSAAATSGPSVGAPVAFPSGTAGVPATAALIALAGVHGQPGSITFQFNLPGNAAGENIPAQTYTETFTYAVECFHGSNGNGGSDGVDTGAASLTLNAIVPSVARFTAASAQNIDFGQFTQTTAKATVYIQSTGNYDVTASTANGSQMVRAGAVTPYPANSVIPYTMTLGGSAISSSSPLLNRPRVGFTAAPFDLQLNIGSLPSGKLSGGYSDTITLNLVPR